MWEKGNWFLSDFCVSLGNPERRNISITRGQMGQSPHRYLTIRESTDCVFYHFFQNRKCPKNGGCGRQSRSPLIPEIMEPGAGGSIPLPQAGAGQLRGHRAPAHSIWHLPRDTLHLGWNVAQEWLGRNCDWDKTWLWGAGHQPCCGRAGKGLLAPGDLNGVLGQGESGVVLGEESFSPWWRGQCLTYVEVSSGNNPLLSTVNGLGLRPQQGCRQECRRWLSFRVLHLHDP